MSKTKIGQVRISDGSLITAVVSELPALGEGIVRIGPKYQLISAWYSKDGVPMADEARVSLTVFHSRDLERIFNS